MKLRTRLGLTALLLAVPLTAVFVAFQSKARKTIIDRFVTEQAQLQLTPAGRERCESDPEGWSRGVSEERVGGVRFAAYRADLSPGHASAPVLAAEQRLELGGGDHAVYMGVPGHMYILVRTPWPLGPCAFVLAMKPLAIEGSILPFDPLMVLYLLPIPIVLLIVLALGPVIERTRKLELAVRASAASAYKTPIPSPGRDEIAELGRAFDRARQEIRAHAELQEFRERTLRDFLADTTHDVMVPLTVLLGHLSDMLRDELPIDRHQVAVAAEQGHYLASLIRNLSVAAQLDGGRPDLERHPVDLCEIVRRAVRRHEPVARGRAIELAHATPDDPVSVLGDETFIEQAVSNVVYNAIRHNREGGHVAVVLTARDGCFTIDVIDDGPGIPAAELTRILERRPTVRRQPGRGLGLNIVQKVAARHSWTFELSPSEYGGLRVRLSGTV